MGPRWNDNGLACCGKGHNQPFIGIECLVGDKCVGLHDRDQIIGADEVMYLAFGQMEAHGVTKSYRAYQESCVRGHNAGR